MRRYEIAIFDVDGTLLDTTEGVLSSVEYTIKEHGLKPLSKKQLLTFVGPPIQNSFRNYYSLHGERLQELAETFRNHYKKYDLLKAVPYEGIYEVFETLKSYGIKLAIATYKRQDYAIELLKYFHFDQYTSVMYGADNFNKLKKKDIILKCMNDSEILDSSKAVMIGDSDNDAIGAESLGMSFIGVTYGFDFKTEADVTKYPAIGNASTPKELIPYFI